MGINPEKLFEMMQLMFKPNPWHAVPIGENAPDVVNVYIEIMPKDAMKYELDKQTGLLKIDRPQLFSNICPALYGFVPQTFCGESVGQFCATQINRPGIKGDGDPLDICVLSQKEVTHVNILLQAVPIGGLRMIDKDEADDKIIAVLKGDATYGEWRDIEECPRSLIEPLRHYFLTYKDVPGGPDPVVELPNIFGHEEAHEIIRRSRADYLEKFGDVEMMFKTAIDGMSKI